MGPWVQSQEPQRCTLVNPALRRWIQSGQNFKVMQTRCAQWCNSGLEAKGVTKYFLAGFEDCSIEGNLGLVWNLAPEIPGPSGKARSQVLLTKYVHCFLNIYIHIRRLVNTVCRKSVFIYQRKQSIKFSCSYYQLQNGENICQSTKKSYNSTLKSGPHLIPTLARWPQEDYHEFEPMWTMHKMSAWPSVRLFLKT